MQFLNIPKWIDVSVTHQMYEIRVNFDKYRISARSDSPIYVLLDLPYVKSGEIPSPSWARSQGGTEGHPK